MIQIDLLAEIPGTIINRTPGSPPYGRAGPRLISKLIIYIKIALTFSFYVRGQMAELVMAPG